MAACSTRCSASKTAAAWPSLFCVRWRVIDTVAERRPSGEATANWV